MKISSVMWLFQGSIVLNLLTSHCTNAQIVPDQTLPNNTIVTPNGETTLIEGGTQAGSNLFHSFREFSVSTRSNAYFNNALDIQNIFSRVTGSSISNIDGLIRSNGAANLFLINPNGIVFGANASLDIGGSFVASTANRVIFSDGFEFSATNPQVTPLLTINVPIGLGFGSSPGQIINQSRHEVRDQLIGRTENAGDFNVDPTIAGLQVKEERSIALVGGNVILEGGNLTTTRGRIEIGSVAGNSIVNLSETETGWQLSYEQVQAFQDISLFPNTIIDSSGEAGGAIQLQGRRITFTGDQNFSPVFIYSNTVEEGTGGIILVKATDEIDINGTFSAVATFPETVGQAGNIIIETQILTLKDGSFIQSSGSIFDEGRAGDVTINAVKEVEMIGTTNTPSPDFFPTAIATFALTGNGGNLSIQTERLILRNGAQISTKTVGKGTAGNLFIGAKNIEIMGEFKLGKDFSYSGINTIAEERLQYEDCPCIFGNAGNLMISTEQLSVIDGGNIAAATFSNGKGGKLLINASESIIISGVGLFSGEPSGLSASSQKDMEGNGGIGNGGSINVTTRQLTIKNGAVISAASFGTGEAGNININADRLLVQNQGIIRTESQVTQGGNITITLSDRLILRNQSNISATAGLAEEAGDGGNITINSPLILAVPTENSDIQANAFEGIGGNINITTEGILGIQERSELTPLSDITASSRFNRQGTVTIANPNANLVNRLVEFPENTVDVPGLVAQNVCRTNLIRGSSFSITGRGGLPPNPSDPLIQNSTIDWETRPQEEKKPAVILKQRSQNQQPVIQQVQGWRVEADGTIILTAEATEVTPQTPTLNFPNCS